MRRLNGNETSLRGNAAIIMGGLIAALAAFVASAGAEVVPGDPDFAAGRRVGYGFAFGFMVWGLAHVLVLRKERSTMKWIGAAVILGCAMGGAAFGASL